jgi:anti-sigma B factor antagonist
MQNSFHIDVERPGDALVVRPHGELDLNTTSELERALLGALERKPRILIVDLGAVEFMDSTGLRALLMAAEQADTAGHEFAVVQGPPQVQRLLDLTKVSDVLRVVADLQDLLGERPVG